MKKTFCDRCRIEMTNNTEESFILKHLDYDEDKEDETWDLCIRCFKELKLFMRSAWKGERK